MTLISWISLVIGICIGMLVACGFSLKALNEQLRWLHKMDEFIKHYSDLCDEQNANLYNHIDKKLDIMSNYLNKENEIINSLLETSKAFSVKVLEFNETRDQELDKCLNNVSSELYNFMDVEDERWSLIVDYIVRQEGLNTIKEDKINEHENLEAEDGAREGPEAGDQEPEQGAGESDQWPQDAELVRGELEAGGGDSAAEAAEEET